MKFQSYYNDLQEYMKKKQFSNRTIESYTLNAKQFFSFLDKFYPRIEKLEKATREILADFQNYLINFTDKKGNNLSNKTINLKMIAVRKLFQVLIQKDLLHKDPTEVFIFGREEQRITKNILSKQQTIDLLKNIKTNTPIGIRNKAMLECAYANGLRTSEICSIKVHDIDLKNQSLTIVKGKGGKTRIVPLTQIATESIRLYIEKARKYMLRDKKTDSGFLFLSSRGNQFDRNSINKTVMKSVTKNVKLDKHISFYSMRHGIATDLLASDVDITYIAKLLGHSSVSITQKYTRVDITDLKKIHSLKHPREISIDANQPPKKNQKIL